MRIHHRPALRALAVGLVATTALSGCAVPSFVPGIGGSGSFDAALEDAWANHGDSVRFAFNDTSALREHFGDDFADQSVDSSEGLDSGAGLVIVGGPPILVERPEETDLDPARRDLADHSDWSQQTWQDGAMTSTTSLEALPEGLSEVLLAEGWTSPDDTTLWAGDSTMEDLVSTRLASVEDGRFTTAVSGSENPDLESTRDFVANRSDQPLTEDKRFTGLRDCIGDAPLAVSFAGLLEEDSGMRAYALVTDADGDELVQRACILAAEDRAAAREALETDPMKNRRAVEATEIEEDGDVISAVLVPKGSGFRSLPVWMHHTFSDHRPPGF